MMFMMRDKGKHPVPHSYIRYAICKTMGWGLEVYRSQPSWFIEDIIAFENIEAQYQNREITTTKY